MRCDFIGEIMQNSEIILYIIKLVLGGITAFLAVSLWSKTKDASWICLVLGFVISYAGIVYQMILDFSLLVFDKLVIFGIPIFTLIFTILPSLLFIIAFILMLCKKD